MISYVYIFGPNPNANPIPILSLTLTLSLNLTITVDIHQLPKFFFGARYFIPSILHELHMQTSTKFSTSYRSTGMCNRLL